MVFTMTTKRPRRFRFEAEWLESIAFDTNGDRNPYEDGYAIAHFETLQEAAAYASKQARPEMGGEAFVTLQEYRRDSDDRGAWSEWVDVEKYLVADGQVVERVDR